VAESTILFSYEWKNQEPLCFTARSFQQVDKSFEVYQLNHIHQRQSTQSKKMKEKGDKNERK
jgi:hypothetical protein